MLKPPNVLLVEVPPQFIALCEASGASPQAALRGMAAMVCGLQYDEDNRLVPMGGAAASLSCSGNPWAVKKRPLPAAASCSLGTGVTPLAASSVNAETAAFTI